EAEKANPKADILLTADVANLSLAENRGLLEKLGNNIQAEIVPIEFKDDYWIALTKRTRILVYAKDRVQSNELSTYADLSLPKWKGRILVRSSNSPYNQSFISAMIAHIGQEKTGKWIEEFVNNFARKPQGGDIDQIKAVAAGEGDIALVNSYYIARMMASNDDDDVNITKNIGVFFPDQDGNGAMLNISGIGIVKNASHKNNAIQLINFMLSNVAQRIYAKNNNEYPINDKIKKSSILDGWGDYKIDNLNIKKIGENLDIAIKLMDEKGWR
ncbi:MAG: extracellular solute-binding protein, partial [Anaplasmataceae bacterium]|nr:extracellular solute-binding protein [Anaplasmataceae bacterium]